jgi:uncharacterized protein YhaN
VSDELERFSTYAEYREAVVVENTTTFPRRTVRMLTEDEFDRERWGIGKMADNEKRFEDHLKDSLIMEQRIMDNTMAHERVATLLEQVGERIKEQQQEIKELSRVTHDTYAKVTNGLTHKVNEIHQMVKDHDEKLLGCVDVDTYRSDHPSGTEVQRSGKKRRLEVLTILIAALAVISTVAGILLWGTTTAGSRTPSRESATVSTTLATRTVTSW